MRTDPRHRGGRKDHPARHVLPDERQLLLRRLLQGGCHRVRLGAGHRFPGRRGVRLPPRPGLGHRLRGRRRVLRPVAQGGRAAHGADPAARQEGQLLAHGGRGTRWSVQRDLHRPRTGVRPGRWPGRRRGPVPGDLEPGVHAVRARQRAEQGGLRHPRRAAEQEHRHRHGPRAGGLPAAGQAQPLRDRRGLPRHRDGVAAVRPQVRRRPRGRRPVPRRRRPRAQRDDADQRRRDTGQRGARVRPAPAAAPRGALDAPARRGGSGPARAAAGEPGQDEALLPRAGLRLGPDLHGRLRRGGGVPHHAEGRHEHLRPGRVRGEGRRPVGAARATRRSRSTTPTASPST